MAQSLVVILVLCAYVTTIDGTQAVDQTAAPDGQSAQRLLKARPAAQVSSVPASSKAVPGLTLPAASTLTRQGVAAAAAASRSAPPSNCWRSGAKQDGHTSHNHSAYIAMCLIAKDAHADIQEWVEHYLKLGVGRVYVFDHDSQPPMLPLLTDFVAAGVLEYHYLTTEYVERKTQFTRPVDLKQGLLAPRVDAQKYTYRQCIRQYRHRHQWMAFFDIDEFLLLKDRRVPDLPTFLKGYEQFGGLAVQWRVFGSSGHKLRPNGSTLANYWQCSSSHTVKTIVNTCFVAENPGSPHHFFYHSGRSAVNADFKRVVGASDPADSVDKVVLNHYLLKSAEEAAAKVRRGAGDGRGKTKAWLEGVDRRTRGMNCSDAVRLMEGRVWRRPSLPQ